MNKEEKEEVLLWIVKTGSQGDLFLHSPFFFFLFLLQYAELSGEIYGISSKALMETDFYHPSQFKALSAVVSPVMTSLFE